MCVQVTQMKHRLQQGEGECFYLLGNPHPPKSKPLLLEYYYKCYYMISFKYLYLVIINSKKLKNGQAINNCCIVNCCNCVVYNKLIKYGKWSARKTTQSILWWIAFCLFSCLPCALTCCDFYGKLSKSRPSSLRYRIGADVMIIFSYK